MEKETTDSWSIGKILKHIFLPKPAGSPKAGTKEILLRLLIALAFFVVLLNKFFLSKSLPTCDKSETQAAIQNIINNQFLKNKSITFVSLKKFLEQGYNKEHDLRACEADLVTNIGETKIQYSIKWSNKEKLEFYVEVQVLPTNQQVYDVITDQENDAADDVIEANLPFIGQKFVNFMGGNSTAISIKIDRNEHVVVKSFNFEGEEFEEFEGEFTNPLILKGGMSLLFKNGIVYQQTNGEIDHGCKGDDEKPCESELLDAPN